MTQMCTAPDSKLPHFKLKSSSWVAAVAKLLVLVAVERIAPAITALINKSKPPETRPARILYLTIAVTKQRQAIIIDTGNGGCTGSDVTVEMCSTERVKF
ncbi:unnamed protein product [Tuber melanosporum]|uniref:(Perigord truffle) hypothetical protein n=1 Tax=Tuber melanosporum (strain Mel28) TaxID=656061 RepID=D5G842_TUBMM|nr:uncharacterized protein GSTUM_00002802001 [Tuber melanosporum]CAZ80685.1 unnamed protein product [Tuber melanosporum]